MSVWKQQFPQLSNSPKSLAELLISGELPVAEYMKWASENYKIPFLADNFFAQAKNFKLILENPSHQWNEFFFPILEWQGMLYIGALEPQEISLEKKICVVLCSPLQLRQLWSKMEKAPSVQKVASAPVASDPLAGILGSKFKLEETKSEVVTAKLEDTKSSAGAPSFANAVFKDVPTDAPPVPAAIPVPSQAPVPSAPPKMSAQAPTISRPAQSVPRTVQAVKPAGPSAPSFQEPMVVPTSHLKSQGVNVNPNFSAGNYNNVPEITNVMRAQKPNANDTNFTSTKTIMPFPDRASQFTFIRTVYSEQIIFDAKGKINENNNPQDALISAFRILKDYYNKLMWVVRDQQGYAYPIACNAAWDFTEEAWNLPMDFKSPNPFRIAKFTQKPFHGAISKNKASDQFFKQWGMNEYPNVLSIVPVKLHGKVFGYFVGCEKGPHFQQQQSIELMESVCNELIQAFIRIHKDLAKAA